MKTSRAVSGLIAGCVALGALCLVAQEPATPAAEPVATVVAVRGDVELARPDGGTAKLQIKSEIPRGSTVKTGERGRIQIRFPDETLISLGRNTTMTIEEFTYKPSEGEGKLVTQVNEGVFRVMGGAITKIAPENFQTKTPTATIGIRGSFYSGRISAGRLEVVFLGGRGITVSNPAGGVEITTPSFGTIVESAEHAPAEPAPFSAEQLNSIAGGSLGGGGDQGEGDKGEGEQTDTGGGDTGGGTDGTGDSGDGADGTGTQGTTGTTSTTSTVSDVTNNATFSNQTTDPAAAQAQPPKPPGEAPADTVVAWNGYAVGASGGGRAPTVYSNTDAADVALNINQTRGTVAGRLTVASGASTLAVTVAGTGSNGGNLNTTLSNSSGATGTLNSTPLPASINPEWMGWGYWQADQPSPRLTVPPTGAPTAAAQWVAGIQTPTSYIQAMRTASYAGAARCVEFTSGGNTFTHQGTSLFSFEFGNAPQLTGAMNFVGGLAMQSQATLNGSGSGFTGTITSVNTGGGVHTEAPNQLVGGFYGPQANALGAIFQVGTTNGTTYTGAAAAAKQ